MTRKQIESARRLLPPLDTYKNYTDEQKQLRKELSCREMINSILIYDCRPDDEKVWDSESRKYISRNEYVFRNAYLSDYKNGKKDFFFIGNERLREIISEQVSDFSKAEVGRSGYDFESGPYNFCKWNDD